MKLKICILTALFVLSGLTEAQVNITVSPMVEKRMVIALEKALSTTVPSWCNTADLQNQRKIIIKKCIKTFYHNYQPVTGDIFHEGVVPSLQLSTVYGHGTAGNTRTRLQDSIKSLPKIQYVPCSTIRILQA